MKQIYIVTRGEYSVYSIKGVFEDKELATEFASQIQGKVEEYEIKTDSILNLPRGFLKYEVYMDENGNTSQVNIIESNSCITSQCNKKYTMDPVKDTYPVPYSPTYTDIYTGEYIFIVDTDKREQGAIKIANEQRAQIIANGLWPVAGEQVKK